MGRKHKDGAGHPMDSAVLTLDSVLADVGLTKFTERFKCEGIDINLFLDLAIDDLRRMLKDLDINWGDRYKQVQKLKNSSKATADETNIDETNVEPTDLQVEIPTLIEEEAPNSCDVCTEAIKNKTMQRVNKHGDSRCVSVNDWPIGNQEIPFDCPKCDQSFKVNDIKTI